MVLTRRGHTGASWDAENAPYLNLGGSYIGIYTGEVICKLMLSNIQCVSYVELVNNKKEQTAGSRNNMNQSQKH